MKILHTADWHLGKRLEQFQRLEEQKAVMEEICQIADEQEVDAVLIAGDLFDTFNPPTEAIDLFYKTLKRLANNGNRAVFAIAGNHDSPDRIETPNPLARECGIIFAGYPYTDTGHLELETGLKVLRSDKGFTELSIPSCTYPFRIIHTAYANEYRLKSYLGRENQEEELRQILAKHWQQLAERYCDTAGVNILMTHLFMIKKGETPPPEPDDERPILHVGGVQAVFTEHLPSQVQYSALGHLHRYIEMKGPGGPAVYSSSPLSYSFAEAEQQKYVVIIEVEPNKAAQLSKVPLNSGKPLLRRKFSGTPEAVNWLQENPNCLVELTIQTDQYISAEERRQLAETHEGIVSIIPELTAAFRSDKTGKSIDLEADMDELFKQYFLSKHKAAPDAAMMALFQEVKAQDDSN